MAGCLLIALLIGALPVTGVAADLAEGPSMPTKTIEEVLTQQTDTLMAIPGVVGVAQGLRGRQPCVTVYVSDKTPQLRQQVPTSLSGYPVEVIQAGQIKARPSQQ